MKRMTTLIGVGIAILIGACISLQPVFNSNVGKYIGTYEAAFTSIAISFSTITIIFLARREGELTQIATVPKVYLLAGVMGATIVTLSIVAVRMLGPATALTIFVAVQIILSVVIEHFGLFQVEMVPINIYKVIGVVLMIVGVLMIKGIKIG